MFLGKWLFNSGLGQLLLALIERTIGLAVVPAEQLANEADAHYGPSPH